MLERQVGDAAHELANLPRLREERDAIRSDLDALRADHEREMAALTVLKLAADSERDLRRSLERDEATLAGANAELTRAEARIALRRAVLERAAPLIADAPRIR